MNIIPMTAILKKILLVALLALGVFVLGGLGGVFFRDRLIPYLVSVRPELSRSDLFEDFSGNVTVIERTEQLVVREDDSVDAVVSQPSTAVVNLIVSGGPSDGEGRTGVLLTNDGIIVSYGAFDEPTSDASTDPIAYHALLFDGTVHEATFLGTDSLTDLSFFRIDGGSFPAVSLANSDDSRPGQKLVAIGNSDEEYQNRFSIGVLSYRDKTFNVSGKTVASSEKWEGVFGMDILDGQAYVGGPAVNFRGEMVGLFGSVLMDGERRVFLLPSNVVRISFSRLTAGMLGDRPELGVYYRTLTRASAIASGEGARDRGAIVYSPSGRTGLSVLAGSPAEKAGIRYGDIIVSVDGTDVDLDHPLPALVGPYSEGDTAELGIVRGGEEISVPVTF